MKFICNACVGQGEPCILDVGNDNSVTLDSLRCVLTDDHYCDWRKYEDDKVANLQPKVAKLPKLTAEVFSRPDCPEWAQFAAVDKYRNAMWYEGEPKVIGSVFWNSQRGQIQAIPGKFDASDWQNSLVERPARFPDWAEVGGYVYDDRNGYGKIVSGSVKSCYIEFDGGAGDFVPEAFAKLKPARLRPYNAEEMKGLVGKVLEDTTGCVSFVTGFEVYKSKIYSGVTSFEADRLLKDCHFLDGSPCGVLEHLEDGEWVR